MATPSQTLTDTRTPQYQALKGKIHQDLLNRLNLGLGSAVSVLIFICVMIIAVIFIKGLGTSRPGEA